jgi:hypothetical protein
MAAHNLAAESPFPHPKSLEHCSKFSGQYSVRFAYDNNIWVASNDLQLRQTIDYVRTYEQEVQTYAARRCLRTESHVPDNHQYFTSFPTWYVYEKRGPPNSK